MGKPKVSCVARGKTAYTSLDGAIFKSNDHSRLKARHLFRALLRQCSYLPDTAARHYAHSYVVERYRRYNPRAPTFCSLTIQRRCTITKQAHKALTLLERANRGYSLHLLKVLSMTYGRVGKRRHEMLQEVIPQGSAKDPAEEALDIPKDENALANLCILINSNFNLSMRSALLAENSNVKAPGKLRSSKDPRNPAGPVLGDRLEALVKSQKQQKYSLSKKSQIKNVTPAIPQTNSWGRPMPPSRVLNLKEKWYAGILDKVQPPLPEWEWNRLRDLILGRISWDGPVQRRTKIVSEIISKNNNSASTTKKNMYTDSSSCSNDDGALEVTDRRHLKSNPHKITWRFMRGLWIQIFLQCPKLQWDAARNIWTVTWGDLHRHKEITLDANTGINNSIFKGVDEQGKQVVEKHPARIP